MHEPSHMDGRDRMNSRHGNGMDRGAMLAAMPSFLVGAAVGAAVALLMAPNSGKDTRQWIGQKTDRIRRRAAEGVDQAREAAGEAWNDLRHDARDVVDSAADALKGRKSAAAAPPDRLGSERPV